MPKRGLSHSDHKPIKIEEKVIENLIQLEKVQVTLAEKFDKLSDQISKLLTLFEMAARSFAQNPTIKATEKDSEFLDKINALLDQNKTIAKGLTLMEERIRERVYGAPKQADEPSMLSMEKMKEETDDSVPSPSPNRPLPRF